MGETKWVWIPDPDKVFVKVELIKEDTIKRPDGSIETVPKDQVYQVNPPQFDRADDIAELTFLNEASVLNNLSSRYSKGEIYTYSGLFLVAVNPYRDLKIYGADTITKYHDKSREDSKPHIYAVADAAFRKMLETRENQSILITGESGAGKTENTKKAIQYLSAITTPKHDWDDSKKTTTDQKILQTNPVLEAFGNAQTVRNNNSSRFGKFIRIEFAKGGTIIGASIEWYLLEKSRVIFQSSQERNYHIFYMMLRGVSKEMKTTLMLDSTDTSDYTYLSSGASFIEGVNDAQNFRDLMQAFKTVGFQSDEIDDILKIVAAVLHLGNIEVVQQTSDQGRINNIDQVKKVCKLLSLKSPEDFSNALLKPKVKAGREVVTQSRSAVQARNSLDALSKSLYERLFGHLVSRLNKALESTGSHAFQDTSFIGVLDIAGFEIFDKNSFEQLCINYTNEKLQQFFNHHMFVLEQAEYVKEEIEWEYIDYGADLQPTIDLIEKSNPMGIFSCLDEDCVMPRANDKSFTEKLTEKWTNKNPKFKPSRLNQGFIIQHYAAPVEYSTEGWLEKNKDPLNEQITDLLSQSSNSLVGDLFPVTPKTEVSASPSKVRRGLFRTVAQRHKEQLMNLMSQLQSTHPHFVRCIVPNQNKTPGEFDNKLVLDQLRCNGVLEGIRIARSGFPNRLEFKEFRERYQALLKNASGISDGKSACEAILKNLQLNPSNFKIGTSKVFFKNGVLAELEELRDRLINSQITNVQALVKGYLVRKGVKRQVFRDEASKIVARTSNIWLKYHDNPWWRLLQNIRPLLSSTDSRENNRKDQRIQKLEENLDRLRSDQSDLCAAKKKLIDQVASLEAERKKAEISLIDKDEVMKRALEQTQTLQDQRNALTDQIVELEKELAVSKQQHENAMLKYADEMKKKNEKLSTLESECGDLTKSKEEVTSNYTALRKSHDKLKSEHTTLATLLKEVTSKAKALESNGAESAKHAINSKRELEESQKQLAEASQKLSSAQIENKRTISELEQLRLKIISLESEISDKSDKLSKIESEKNSAVRRLAAMETELKSARKELEEARRETIAAKALAETAGRETAEFAALKANSEAVSAKAREREDLAERVQAENAKLRGDLLNESAKSALLEKKLSLAESKLASAETRQKDAESLRSTETAKISSLVKSQATLKEQLLAAEAKPAELEQQLSMSRKEIAELKASLAERDMRYADLQKQHEATQRQLRSTEPTPQLVDLQSQLMSANSRNSELEAQVSRWKQKILELENKHGNLDQLAETIDKIQKEKAEMLEANSKLMFGMQNQRRTSQELALEKAKNIEVKKMQSEIKVLKLKLVKAEREYKMGTSDDGARIMKERDDAIMALSLLKEENARLRNRKSSTSVFDQPIEVPRRRPALRVISGNDRKVSHSKSEKLLSKISTGGDVQELLNVERERNQDLEETMHLFRNRAYEYQSKIETAEAIMKNLKRTETELREELQNAKRKHSAQVAEYESELTAKNTLITKLQHDLDNANLELSSARGQISDAGVREVMQQKVHNLRMSLGDVTAERDRLIAEKMKLEKRLSHVLTDDGPRHEGQDKKLQELLGQTQREIAAQKRKMEELSSQVQHNAKQAQWFQDQLQEAEYRNERQRQELDDLRDKDLDNELIVKRLNRELNSAREEVLRSVRRVEHYKARYDPGTPRDRDAFI